MKGKSRNRQITFLNSRKLFVIISVILSITLVTSMLNTGALGYCNQCFTNYAFAQDNQNSNNDMNSNYSSDDSTYGDGLSESEAEYTEDNNEDYAYNNAVADDANSNSAYDYYSDEDSFADIELDDNYENNYYTEEEFDPDMSLENLDDDDIENLLETNKQKSEDEFNNTQSEEVEKSKINAFDEFNQSNKDSAIEETEKTEENNAFTNSDDIYDNNNNNNNNVDNNYYDVTQQYANSDTFQQLSTNIDQSDDTNNSETISNSNSLQYSNDSISGSGTTEDPFIVTTSKQLLQLKDVLVGKPDSVIQLYSTIILESDDKWEPLFNDSDNPFTGTFDGRGNCIIFSNAMQQNPLFGHLGSGAIIKNLNIYATLDVDNDTFGMFCTQIGRDKCANNVSFINCGTSGTVKSTHSFDTRVGGFVGEILNYSTVNFISCTNSAEVTNESLGARFCGGFVGYASDSNITYSECQNKGKVEAVGATSYLYTYGVMALQIVLTFVVGKYCTNLDEASYSVKYKNTSEPVKPTGIDAIETLTNDKENIINNTFRRQCNTDKVFNELTTLKEGDFIPSDPNVNVLTDQAYVNPLPYNSKQGYNMLQGTYQISSQHMNEAKNTFSKITAKFFTGNNEISSMQEEAFAIRFQGQIQEEIDAITKNINDIDNQLINATGETRTNLVTKKLDYHIINRILKNVKDGLGKGNIQKEVISNFRINLTNTMKKINLNSEEIGWIDDLRQDNTLNKLSEEKIGNATDPFQNVSETDNKNFYKNYKNYTETKYGNSMYIKDKHTVIETETNKINWHDSFKYKINNEAKNIINTPYHGQVSDYFEIQYRQATREMFSDKEFFQKYSKMLSKQGTNEWKDFMTETKRKIQQKTLERFKYDYAHNKPFKYTTKDGRTETLRFLANKGTKEEISYIKPKDFERITKKIEACNTELTGKGWEEQYSLIKSGEVKLPPEGKWYDGFDPNLANENNLKGVFWTEELENGEIVRHPYDGRIFKTNNNMDGYSWDQVVDFISKNEIVESYKATYKAIKDIVNNKDVNTLLQQRTSLTKQLATYKQLYNQTTSTINNIYEQITEHWWEQSYKFYRKMYNDIANYTRDQYCNIANCVNIYEYTTNTTTAWADSIGSGNITAIKSRINSFLNPVDKGLKEVKFNFCDILKTQDESLKNCTFSDAIKWNQKNTFLITGRTQPSAAFENFQSNQVRIFKKLSEVVSEDKELVEALSGCSKEQIRNIAFMELYTDSNNLNNINPWGIWYADQYMLINSTDNGWIAMVNGKSFNTDGLNLWKGEYNWKGIKSGKLFEDDLLKYGSDYKDICDRFNANYNDLVTAQNQYRQQLDNWITQNNINSQLNEIEYKKFIALRNLGKYSTAVNVLNASMSNIKNSLLSNALEQAAKSLPTGEEGLGGVHYDSFSGGFIGNIEEKEFGSNFSVKFDKCDNLAEVTGGSEAGGFVGLSNNYNVSFSSCINSSYSTIGVTDSMCSPSSGGLVGSFVSSSSKYEFNIYQCMNQGTILSRKIAGGLVGTVTTDSEFKIENSCSTGGIAGTDGVGGLIGYAESSPRITLNNCYAYCIFDTSTLNTSQYNWSTWCIIPGLTDWTSTAKRSNYEPGTLCGVLCVKNFIVSNCYGLDGNDAVGSDEYGGRTFNEYHKVNLDDFNKGVVAYKLNRDGDYFGQVLDDKSLGKGEYMQVPVPGLNATVYRDTHNSETIYTNYNPRTIKLRKLTIFTENASTTPANSSVQIREGDDYNFTVIPAEGYKIKSVMLKSASGTEEELTGLASADYISSYNAKDYSIVDIKDNYTIVVTTEAIEYVAPIGYGTESSPYLIQSVNDLLWFANYVGGWKSVNISACAKLTADIDLGPNNFKPMYSIMLPYKGTFDGNNHTISNLQSTSSDFSFFTYIDGGVVKNLTLSGQFGNAAFADCARDTKFINCVSEGSVNSSSVAAGGICAKACGNNNMVFQDCINNASISKNNGDQYTSAGGICGQITDESCVKEGKKNSTVNVTFEHCKNNGNVCSESSFDNYSGGIVGTLAGWRTDKYLVTTGSSVVIKNCVNSANVYGKGNQTSCGGIMASFGEMTTGFNKDRGVVDIVNCANTGNIGYDDNGNLCDAQDSGGILGWTYNNSTILNIKSCVQLGKVGGRADAVTDGIGGFIGSAQYGEEINLSNSYTSGQIENRASRTENFGYFVGWFGTPVIELISLMINAFTSPDCCVTNSYYSENSLSANTERLPNMGKNHWRLIAKNHHVDFKCFDQVSDEDLYKGVLGYRLNSDPDKPTIGQNIDMKTYTKDGSAVVGSTEDEEIENSDLVQLQRQYTPYIIGDDLTKYPTGIDDDHPTVRVYKRSIDNQDWYTNFSGVTTDGTYKIDASSDNGFIAGNFSANEGDSVTLSLIPKEGYFLHELVVDDNNVSNLPADNQYTFTDIHENHKIYAKFATKYEPAKSDEQIDDKTTYIIKNAPELIWFRDEINSGKDYNAILGEDIDLSTVTTWSPIDNFKGSFYGSSKDDINSTTLAHTIKLREGTNLFNTIRGENNDKRAQIRNLKLDGVCNKAYDFGFLAKDIDKTDVYNTIVSGSMNIVNNNKNYIGGFCKCAWNSTKFENCTSSVRISGSSDHEVWAAGFVGIVYKGSENDVHSLEMNNCKYTGFINISDADNSRAAAALAFCESNYTTYQITDFTNKGSITADYSAGSIVGEISSTRDYTHKGGNLNITGCRNFGTIQADNAGGILGKIYWCPDIDVNITGCENCGDIVSVLYHNGFVNFFNDRARAGGIIGMIDDRDVNVYVKESIVSCNNIESNGLFAGGLVGSLDDANKFETSDIIVSFNSISSKENQCGFLIGNIGSNAEGNESCSGKILIDKSSCQNLKMQGNGKKWGRWNKECVSFIGKSQLKSGEAAYIINESCKKDALGQVIDLANTVKEQSPHVKGQKIYQNSLNIQDGSINKNVKIYSNYEQNADLTDKVVLFVENLSDDKSTGSSYPAANSLVDKGSSFNVDFIPSGNCWLSEVKVDGVVLDDKDDVYDENTYRFNNVQNNVKISYKFEYGGKKPIGDGTEKSHYIIKHASELCWLSTNINNGKVKNDCYVDIVKDIDMSNVAWTCIKNFSGNIQGSKKSNGEYVTISNLKMISRKGQCSFIENCDNACIKDLTLNVNFEGAQVGGIALNSSNTTFDNVQVTGSINCLFTDQDIGQSGTYYRRPIIGGFVCFCGDTTIFKSCVSNATLATASTQITTRAGGFVGGTLSIKDKVKFLNCINRSNIKSNTEGNSCTSGSADAAGGFVGHVGIYWEDGGGWPLHSDCHWLLFSNCINTGSIYGDCAGGLIGALDTLRKENANIDIQFCSNFGEITGYNVGGFVGLFDDCADASEFVFDRSMNYGKVSSLSEDGNAGGIIGKIDLKHGLDPDGNGVFQLNDVGNIGTIYSCGNSCSGLIGEIEDVKKVTINRCLSLGSTTGSAKGAAYCADVDDEDIETKNSCKNEYTAFNGDNREDVEEKMNGCETFTLDQFASGEVGYWLNNKTGDPTSCNWSQTLDDFTTQSSKDAYPFSTCSDESKAKRIYKIDRGEGLAPTYSNFQYTDKDQTRKLYSVELNSSQYGNIQPNTVVHKYEGDSLTFTVKPWDGCVLTKLTISDLVAQTEPLDITNEVKKSKDMTYCIKNVKSHLKVYAEFSGMAKPAVGDGSASNPYILTSYTELRWFSNEVNSGNNEINAKLGCNIKAQNYINTNWEPIGSKSKYPFKGTFDGGEGNGEDGDSSGYIIDGLTALSGNNAAMFRYCSGANIKNLKLQNIYYQLSKSDTKAAGLCNYATNNTKIENVMVSGSVYGTSMQSGLINVVTSGCNISKCYVNIKTTPLENDSANVSGVINELVLDGNVFNANNVVVSEKCKIESNSEATGYRLDSHDHAAGFVGVITGSGEATFDRCVNIGVVKGDTAGGVIADVNASNASINLIDCTNINRVYGNQCGGLIGKVNGGASDVDVKLTGCLNSGQIGVSGGVIEAAGGLVGYFRNTSLDIDFVNCTNTGSVVNEETNSNTLTRGMATSGLSVGFLFTALSFVSAGTATIVFGVVLMVIQVIGFIMTAVQSRAFTTQYAGGIFGDGFSSHLNLTNIVNYGAVNGESHSAAIGSDDSWKTGSVNNVYYIEGACINDNVDYEIEGAESVPLNDFVSGKIGYLLQEASMDGDKYLDANECTFGQRIDRIDPNTVRETIPVYKKDPVHIYQYFDESKKEYVYTNFDKSQYDKEQYELDLKFVCKDNTLQEDNVLDNIDISVQGDRSEGNCSKGAKTSGKGQELFTQNYHVKSADLNTLHLAPKENNFAITNIKLVSKNKNETKKYSFADNEVKYNNDGSVDIIISERANADRVLEVSCVNNGVRVEKVNDKEILCFPWNSTSEFPTESTCYDTNNYYFTEDIVQHDAWNALDGEVNICLAGHKVLFTGEKIEKLNSLINVNNQSTSLNIFDDNFNKTVYYYKNATVPNFEKVNQEEAAKLFENHNDINNILDSEKQLVFGGIITTDKGGGIKLINATTGALSISDVLLYNGNINEKSGNNPVVSFTASKKDILKGSAENETKTISDFTEDPTLIALHNSVTRDIVACKGVFAGLSSLNDAPALTNAENCYTANLFTFNNRLYSAPVESKLFINCTIFSHSSECGAINTSSDKSKDNHEASTNVPIVFGNNTNFYNCKMDLCTSSQITFAQDYEFKQPISVTSPVKKLVLTDGFDNYMEKGVSFKSAFSTLSSDGKLALSGTGDKANEVTYISLKNIEVADSSDASSDIDDTTDTFFVRIPKAEYATINPTTNTDNDEKIEYVVGSDVKVHLNPDSYAAVESINVLRDGKQAYTIDSTYYDNEFVYKGQMDAEKFDEELFKFTHGGKQMSNLPWYTSKTDDEIYDHFEQIYRKDNNIDPSKKLSSRIKGLIRDKYKIKDIIKDRDRIKQELNTSSSVYGKVVKYEGKSWDEVYQIIRSEHTSWDRALIKQKTDEAIAYRDAQIAYRNVKTREEQLKLDKLLEDCKKYSIVPVSANQVVDINFSFKPQAEKLLEGEYNNWGVTYALPKKAGKYRLTDNVVLSETWTAPKGEFALDLNGHTITQETAGLNVIKVEDEKSALLITDSTIVGKKAEEVPISMYVKQVKHDTKVVDHIAYDITTYEKDDFNDASSFPVRGGAIYGANIEPQGYYAYDTKAGAIVVDKGVLHMYAGNIVANNAGALQMGTGNYNEAERYHNHRGVEGGAAITVNEDAGTLIYENANIKYNSITGDRDYQSNNFSAGVQSSGNLVNSGTISNNTSFDYAASAVAVNDGKFENKGTISNNICESESYGCVYNEAEFDDFGKIVDNEGESEQCGLVNNGKFTLENGAIFSGNKYKKESEDTNNSEDKQDIKYCDIKLGGGKTIEFNSKYNCNTPLNVSAFSSTDYPVTSNWNLTKCNNSDTILRSTNDQEINTLTNSGEVYFTDKSNTFSLDIFTKGKGSATIHSTKTSKATLAKKSESEITVEADQGWSIASVVLGDDKILEPNEVGKVSHQDVSNAIDASDSSSAIDQSGAKEIITEGIYTIKDVEEDTKITITFISDEERAKLGDTVLWTMQNSLPSSPGSYILAYDVTLSDEWVCPASTDQRTEIDLAGHSITQNTVNKSAIKIDNEFAHLVIKDSHKNVVRKYSKNKNNTYTSTFDGNYSMYGGYIGGCMFDGNQSAGAIVVTNGRLQMDGGNVALNYAKRSVGSAAIYVNKSKDAPVYNYDPQNNTADVVLGSDVGIMLNTAIGNVTDDVIENKFSPNGSSGMGDNELAASIVAGISTNRGLYTSACIQHNIVKQGYSAAIYSENVYSWVVNKGKITNNVAIDDAVAGISASKSQFVRNYGSIVKNTGYDWTFSSAWLDDCKMYNYGTISGNTSDTACSYPGIVLEGDNSGLVLGEGSKIYDNKYSEKWSDKSYSLNCDVVTLSKNNSVIDIESKYECPEALKIDPLYVLCDAQSFTYDDDSKTHKTKEHVINNFSKLEDELNTSKYFATTDLNTELAIVTPDTMSVVDKDNNVKISFNDNGLGQVSHRGEYVFSKDTYFAIDYWAKCDPNSVYKIGSVTFDGVPVELSNENFYSYRIVNTTEGLMSTFNNDNRRHSIFVNYVYKSSRTGDDDKATLWKDTSNMPKESGVYTLDTNVNDITLDKVWEIPKDTIITMDLNGRTLSSECDDWAVKLNENSELYLCDSSKLKHKFNINEDGRYILDEEDGDHELEGGLFVGNEDCTDTRAFYVCKNAKLNLSNVNVVGFANTNYNTTAEIDTNPAVFPYSKIGAAILNEGKVVIDKSSSLVGNIADIAGAIMNKGLVIVDGNIRDNCAYSNAASIYNDGLFQYGKDSKIQDNYIYRYQDMKFSKADQQSVVSTRNGKIEAIKQ